MSSRIDTEVFGAILSQELCLYESKLYSHAAVLLVYLSQVSYQIIIS